MIVTGTLEPTLCHVPNCGQIRCTDCGERMSCQGPEPAPRCTEHPTCTDCATHPVYCWECREVLRGIAEDRAEQAAFDAARERSL